VSASCCRIGCIWTVSSAFWETSAASCLKRCSGQKAKLEDWLMSTAAILQQVAPHQSSHALSRLHQSCMLHQGCVSQAVHCCLMSSTHVHSCKHALVFDMSKNALCYSMLFLASASLCSNAEACAMSGWFECRQV